MHVHACRSHLVDDPGSEPAMLSGTSLAGGLGGAHARTCTHAHTKDQEVSVLLLFKHKH